MKKIVLILHVLAFATHLSAQSLIGAWQMTTTDEAGREIKNVVIFSEKHQVATWHDLKTGEFISCNGGGWSQDGNVLTETVEFDTNTPERVGTEVAFEIQFDDNKLSAVDYNIVWSRIDDGSPGLLSGAWLITSRMRSGQMQSISTDRSRKTMKILSGTRFQWIAYDTESKEFKGTGGGTYTTTNGKYTEKIEFFSRDISRVGASLEFDFELKLGDWVHSGKTSKGDPLYEFWSPR